MNTETQSEVTTVPSCVEIVDGRPYYQLLADRVTLQHGIRHGDKEFAVQVTLKPYTVPRVLQWLKDKEYYSRPAKHDRGFSDVEGGSVEADREFFHDHFISASWKGRALTLDELERLDARYGIKANVVNIGLNGIHTEIGDDSDSDFEALLEDRTSIPQYSEYVGPDGKEVRIDMAHHFKSPDASAAIKYGRTTKLRTGRGIQKYIVNWESRLKMHDEMVGSADGMLLGKEFCTTGNKQQWIDKIPALFKLAAIDQLLNQTKNG